MESRKAFRTSAAAMPSTASEQQISVNRRCLRVMPVPVASHDVTQLFILTRFLSVNRHPLRSKRFSLSIEAQIFQALVQLP